MAYTPVNPYITVAELHEELKNNEAPLNDELAAAIDRASRWVDDYMDADFFFHDYSVFPLVLDQTADNVIGNRIFFSWPIISISGMTLGGASPDVLATPDDYFIGGGAQSLYRASGNWNLSRPDNILSITGAFGYRQESSPGVYDPSQVPQGIPAKVKTATRLVAAAFSGYNRKEVLGVDGTKEGLITTSIPKTVYEYLGRRGPILI